MTTQHINSERETDKKGFLSLGKKYYILNKKKIIFLLHTYKLQIIWY
jgi:hypothetical protein